MNLSQVAISIRVFRKLKGLTLPQLALKAGVSKGGLSKLENGKGNPTVETVDKIYRAMGIVLEFKPLNKSTR